MKRSLLFCLLSFWTLNSFSQNLIWGDGYSGLGQNDVVNQMVQDAQGDLIIVGLISDTVDFDPGPGQAKLPGSGNNSYYYSYITKMSPGGNLVWAKGIGDTGTISICIFAVTTDSLNNIYVCGNFKGDVDFDPSNGAYSINSPTQFQYFVAKYDPNGAFIWALASPVWTYSSSANSIALDKDLNIYVGGTYQGVADFDPSSNVYSYSSQGQGDLFFLRFDPSGNLQLAKAIGGTGNEKIHTLRLDHSGNILINGEFNGQMDFDPGTQNFTLTPACSGPTCDDVYVAKYDPFGNFIWAVRMGDIGFDYGNNMVIGNQNDVYACGQFTGVVDFDPGTGTAIINSQSLTSGFFLHLDSNSNYITSKAFLHSSGLATTWRLAYYRGRIYISGGYYGPMDFDPGTGTHLLNNNSGCTRSFLSTLDTNGNYISVMQLTGTHCSKGDGLVIDTAENIYLGGLFDQTTDLDPSTGITNIVSGGGYDIFIAKYSKVIVSNSGMEDIEADHYQVYPVPANEIVTISAFNNNMDRVDLADITGKIIFSQEVKNESELRIDVSAFDAGIYFIILHEKNGVSFPKKIVKIN